MNTNNIWAINFGRILIQILFCPEILVKYDFKSSELFDYRIIRHPLTSDYYLHPSLGAIAPNPV